MSATIPGRTFPPILKTAAPSILGNTKTLFNNNKAESAYFFGWLFVAILSQIVRIWPKISLPTSFALMVVGGLLFALAVVGAWNAVTGQAKDNGKEIFTAIKYAAICIWVGVAAQYPDTFTWFFWVTISWFIVLALIYVPILQIVLQTKHQKPIKMELPKQVETPQSIDPFDGIPWLKGAKWQGGHRSLPNGVGTMRILVTPPGRSASALAKNKTGDMAALLEANELEVELTPGRSNNQLIVKHYTDDVQNKPKTWPLTNIETFDIHQPIPFGVNRDGTIAQVHLLERHMLLGGISGSGKSCAVALLVSAAALDPNVDLYLIDPKAADMAMFKDRAVRYCQNDPRAWLECLKTVGDEIHKRQILIADARLRKVHTLPLDQRLSSIVLVIDELASLTSELTDRQLKDEIISTLMTILRTGRSADVTVIAATQRPSAEAVSGDLRSQFQVGAALKVRSQVETNMILGDSSPVDASIIPGSRKGLCWLQTPDYPTPVLTRTFYLNDLELEGIVGRCGTALNPHTAPIPDAPQVVPKAERYPDGTPLGDGWRAELWKLLRGDKWQPTPDLVATIGGSDASVKRALAEWLGHDWIQLTPGKPNKWRRV